MQLEIGQKVSYPNQGVCLVEEYRNQRVGENTLKGYFLRVLGDNSTIFVPAGNTDTVGIRPLISIRQCKKLITKLSDDFEAISCDWKTRSREFAEKLRSGDVFQVADVLKMLTFLSHEKRLSFREQTLLERAKFLIISEIRSTLGEDKVPKESEIIRLVEAACTKHSFTQTPQIGAAAV